jgi:hypothetical protein
VTLKIEQLGLTWEKLKLVQVDLQICPFSTHVSLSWEFSESVFNFQFNDHLFKKQSVSELLFPSLPCFLMGLLFLRSAVEKLRL